MYKQVIILRKDLEMGKGKMISQCCHASLGSWKDADARIREQWEADGGKKIVLRVDGLKELKNLYKKARAAKLPCFIVRDAGLTQVRKGTLTVLGVGPADEEKIDTITGELKLL